mmetsp:Transcript_32429/g.49616  ORF Transcript_32429/g.49616 Transcript_32429/m.49616 type:complete len:112 (-) Transcript_32429:737-1072(-)
MMGLPEDSLALFEYYSELFLYAPAILSEAVRQGNSFERFKLCIKFAFSLIHCMTLQDVHKKVPIVPFAGETYEGMFLMPDGRVDIFMESDFREHLVNDLMTGAERKRIKKD